MLHSIKDLENWLERHGKILESKIEMICNYIYYL